MRCLAPSDDGYFHYWDLADNWINKKRVSPQLGLGAGGAVPLQGPVWHWITYDDPDSISTKVHYARNMNLGGVFVWELALESRPAAPKSYPLTNAAADCLND